MKDKKVMIVLMISIFVFFIVMFLLFGVKNIKKGNIAATIVVGDTSIFTYQNRQWNNIRNSSSVQSLNWKPFHIFVDNEELGEYYLWHNDGKWYVFDQDNNAVLIDGNLLAYNSNFEIPVSSFVKENVTDRKYVDSVLMENNISISSEFTTIYQVPFDLDQDGVEEMFYVVSNAFIDEYEPESIFSFVFMVKEEEVVMIYKEVNSNRSFNGCKPFITSFLDVDQDDTYELLLGCGRYSIGEQIDMLYDYEKPEFKILISNQ